MTDMLLRSGKECPQRSSISIRIELPASLFIGTASGLLRTTTLPFPMGTPVQGLLGNMEETPLKRMAYSSLLAKLPKNIVKSPFLKNTIQNKSLRAHLEISLKSSTHASQTQSQTSATYYIMTAKRRESKLPTAFKIGIHKCHVPCNEHGSANQISGSLAEVN